MSRKYQYFYLVHIQFLGFRFHGWQKQPGIKTIQLEIERRIKWILGEYPHKTLATSRTDSMVSANEFTFELFSVIELNCDELLTRLNGCLPPDIKALRIKQVDKSFQIMDPNNGKEYFYFFSHNEKAHPFSAPFITTMIENLDIELMKKAASMFEGEHNFKKFCYKPNENKQFIRSIKSAKIVENDILKANFFPKESYVLKIKGSGFMRYQVRMMMGFLFNIGLGQKSLHDLAIALSGKDTEQHSYIAPASGLVLNSIFKLQNLD